MSRGGIGSARNAAAAGGNAASSSAPRYYQRSAEEIAAAFEDDPQDMVSASLDAEFEGGQWINGEFFYTDRKVRRPLSKAEQIYGFDEDADREFYANYDKRNASKTKFKPGGGKVAGGIAFVLGSTLQPEGNKREKEEAAKAAAAAASAAAAAVQDGPIDMDESDDTPSAAEPPAVSFQSLRQSKAAGGSASRRARERDEEEDALAAGRGAGIGFGNSTNNNVGISAPPKARPAPAKVDKEFGAFNKHGTGFGLKMLAKSGYRPGDRLGKHGTGVVNPIIARLRPATMGLGFGNYKEVDKSHMARNAFEEEQLEKEKMEAKKKKQQEKEEGKLKTQGWKNDSKSGSTTAKPKRVYKTAAEVLASETQHVSPMVVLDMRGPSAKVTSLDQVTSSMPIEVSEGDGGPPPQMLPELQHNLRLLVSMTEESLRQIEHERKQSQKKLEQLQYEKEQLETVVEVEEGHITQLRRMMTHVEETAKALKGISRMEVDSLTKKITLVVKMLRTLQMNYPEEYVIYELPQRSMPLIYPLIKGLLYGWDPLGEPSKVGEGSKNVLEHLAQFKPFLSPPPTSSQHQHHHHHHRPHSHHPPPSLYVQLLEELFLPKIRLELSNTSRCNVKNDVKRIIRMLNEIKIVCTPELFLNIILELIVPRLKHEVTHWNPRIDPHPIHEWILPYTNFIPEIHLHKLYDGIRTKLSITLQEWSPFDESAFKVLQPWCLKFTTMMFENLLQRSILPKLQQIWKQFVINPAKQDLAPFQAVLPWINLVETLPAHAHSSSSSVNVGTTPPTIGTQLRHMLLTEFFPKWFHALYTWLSQSSSSIDDTGGGVDFEEVGQWYQGWKGQFPPNMLQDPYVKQCFVKGLDLINQAMSEQPIEGLYRNIVTWIQNPANMQQIDATAATVRPTTSTPAPASVQPSPSTLAQLSLDGAAGDAEFLALILQFATHHGIEFVPHLKKGTVQGKQIYLFGHTQVYASKGVVYTKKDGASSGSSIAQWTPIALADLLAIEQQSNGSAQQKESTTNKTEQNRTKYAETTAVPMEVSNEDVD